jgi:hypothetical protein
LLPLSCSYGEWHAPDGCYYIGTFQQNRYHGWGVSHDADGEKRVGWFQCGEFQGSMAGRKSYHSAYYSTAVAYFFLLLYY